MYGFLNQSLGTLAAQTAITSTTRIDSSRLQGCRIVDIFGRFSFSGKTSGDGPVYYGFSHGDLSVGDIAEVFASDPQSQDDTAGEDAMRQIIVIGVMPKTATSSGATQDMTRWTKLTWPSSWVIREGQNFNTFAFN